MKPLSIPLVILTMALAVNVALLNADDVASITPQPPPTVKRVERFRVTCPFCHTKQQLVPMTVSTNSQMYWGTPPGTNYNLTLGLKCGNAKCLRDFPANFTRMVPLVIAEEAPDIDDAIRIPPPLPQVPLSIVPPTPVAPDLSILRVPPGHVLVTIPLADISQEELLSIIATNKATASLVIVRPK